MWPTIKGCRHSFCNLFLLNCNDVHNRLLFSTQTRDIRLVLKIFQRKKAAGGMTNKIRTEALASVVLMFSVHAVPLVFEEFFCLLRIYVR